MAIPLLKETRTLANARAMSADAPGFLLATGLREGPLFRIGVGPLTLNVVAEPDALQQVLQKQARAWGRGTAVKSIRPLLGNGLPMSDPPLWLTQRRTMQPSFHRSNGSQWVHVIRDVTTPLLDQLTDGKTFTARHLMMTIARDVIVRAMFSHSLGNDTHLMDQAFEEVEAYVSNSMKPGRIPSWVPTPTNLRFKRAATYLHSHLQQIIETRRTDEAPPSDLLTLLLRARDPETGAGMSDSQLRDEVMNIFFAGHETTANLMTWAFFLLSQHPDVLARAEAEVQTVLGSRPPEPDDVPKLKYLGAVIRETLRIYPPAWLFARQALEPQQLAGHVFIPGEVVLIVPYITQRLSTLWKNPNTFDPERFAADQSTDAAAWKYTYLPFGAGPHVCIGNHFALLEATLVLALMMQRGRLEVPKPQEVRAKMGATLFVENALPVRFVKRLGRRMT